MNKSPGLIASTFEVLLITKVELSIALTVSLASKLPLASFMSVVILTVLLINPLVEWFTVALNRILTASFTSMSPSAIPLLYFTQLPFELYSMLSNSSALNKSVK